MDITDTRTFDEVTPKKPPVGEGDQDAAVVLNSGQPEALQFKPVYLPDFPALESYQSRAEPANASLAKIKELAEELADDMFRVMEWMKRLEAKQEQLFQQVNSLQGALQENKRQSSIDIGQLRQDLLGERKVLAVRGAFNAIVPMLDALRGMRQSLDDTPENSTFGAQLYAVIASLTNIIQSFGFMEFQVEAGAAFDPFFMECLGFGAGEPNTVVDTLRPGYRTESTVIRPCGVVIARTSQPENLSGNGQA